MIDREVGENPPKTAPSSPPIALASAIVGDAVADGIDPAELLDVDMDRLAGFFALVADGRRFGGAGRQAASPAPAQDDADGGERVAQAANNGRAAEALAPEAPRSCLPRRAPVWWGCDGVLTCAPLGP